MAKGIAYKEKYVNKYGKVIYLYYDRSSLKTYIKEHIKLLERDFGIHLSDRQITHLKSLPSEIAVDNACESIISEHLENFEERQKSSKTR